MNARGVDIALSHGRDLRSLRDDQAGRRTLAVVRGCPRSRHPAWHSAISGQWRHEDTIAEIQIAENYGVVKARHARDPVIVRNCVQLRATWIVDSRLRFERSIKLHRGEMVGVVADRLEHVRRKRRVRGYIAVPLSSRLSR